MEVWMNINSVPFARSYWVVPGKLLAGYYPGDLDTSKMEKKLKGLLQAGIKYVINLMEENEQNWCRWQNKRVPKTALKSVPPWK